MTILYKDLMAIKSCAIFMLAKEFPIVFILDLQSISWNLHDKDLACSQVGGKQTSDTIAAVNEILF